MTQFSGIICGWIQARHHLVKQYTWRWDKSNLDYYYQCTNNNLNAATIPDLWECDTNCSCVSHSVAINIYYRNIVAVLHSAARNAIQRKPQQCLKPFWNKELVRLKHDSIFWHNLWVDTGTPSSGVFTNY